MPQNTLYPTQGILHLILSDKEKLLVNLQVNVCLEKSDQDTLFCHCLCKQICMYLVCFAYVNKCIYKAFSRNYFLNLKIIISQTNQRKNIDGKL